MITPIITQNFKLSKRLKIEKITGAPMFKINWRRILPRLSSKERIFKRRF